MTEQDVYEKVKAEIESQVKQDKRLNAILKKVNDGKADFNDTAEYSERISNILGNVLSGSVEDMTEFGLKENVCKRLLKDRYSDINTLMTNVQSALDKKSGINLAAKQADFPIDRVAQIAHSLEDPTVDIDTIKRRADSPVANVSKSFHDDYIEENASFRNDAGLKCFIERTSDGKCCPWCSEVAGRYVYGEEPDGTFRRHDNCNCRIVYSNGRVVQTLQGTKKSWEVGNEIAFEEYKPNVLDKNDVKEFKPTVLSKEQANKAELNALNNSVDKTAESDIIKEREMLPRKSKQGDFSIDWNTVQSKEYSEKFKKLSSDKKISSAVETRAKWALNNRDAVQTEELYAVNLNTGNEIARITDQNYIAAVKRTDRFTSELDKADLRGDSILLIHNHPRGMPPSINDINALFKNKNVTGITVGHNGSIYRYTRPLNKIDKDDWYIAMKHFNKYSEITAMEKALEVLSKKYGFVIEKL